MQAFISQKCINNIAYLLSGIETLGAQTDQNNRPLHMLCIVPQWNRQCGNQGVTCKQLILTAVEFSCGIILCLYTTE